MKRSKFFLILLFLITAALGAASIWIGWRLSREKEVTPEEGEASGGNPGDHLCIDYNNNPNEWGHTDICIGYGYGNACNGSLNNYYAGKGCRGCCSKRLPCTKQQVDYNNDYIVVVYGPKPEQQWCRQYLNAPDDCVGGSADSWDWTECTVCDYLDVEWNVKAGSSRGSVKLKKAEMYDMDNISYTGSGYVQNNVGEIKAKQRMRIEIKGHDASGNVIGSASNISGNTEFLPSSCELTYVLGSGNDLCNWGKESCSMDDSLLCCDGNGPRWGTWNGGYKCKVENKEWSFDLNPNASRYSITFYVEGFSSVPNKPSKWKTSSRCVSSINVQTVKKLCGDTCTNEGSACDDGTKCMNNNGSLMCCNDCGNGVLSCEASNNCSCGGGEEPNFSAQKRSSVRCINNNTAAIISYTITVRNTSTVQGVIEYVEDTYDSRFKSNWVSNIRPTPDRHSGNVIRWDNNGAGYTLPGGGTLTFSYDVTVPSEYFGTYNENNEFVPYQYKNFAIVKPKDKDKIELTTTVEIKCPPLNGIFDNAIVSSLMALLFVVLGVFGLRYNQQFSYLVNIGMRFKGVSIPVLFIRNVFCEMLDRIKYSKKERLERKFTSKKDS